MPTPKKPENYFIVFLSIGMEDRKGGCYYVDRKGGLDYVEVAEYFPFNGGGALASLFPPSRPCYRVEVPSPSRTFGSAMPNLFLALPLNGHRSVDELNFYFFFILWTEREGEKNGFFY